MRASRNGSTSSWPRDRGERLCRRRGRARNVEQVLDLLDALDLLRPHLEVLDQLRLLDLAAEDDLAVLGVDVDAPFRDVHVAEDLRLDLERERRVVGLERLVQADRLLLRAADRRNAPDGARTASAPALRVEEVREQGPEGHVSELAKHPSPLTRWQVRTTLNGQGETG